MIWADRRFKLGYGRVIALYVMAYTAGRGWIEYLRIDPVQLDDVAGLRLNVWVSIVLFVLAAAYFVWQGRRHPGREETVYVEGREPAAPRGCDRRYRPRVDGGRRDATRPVTVGRATRARSVRLRFLSRSSGQISGR